MIPEDKESIIIESLMDPRYQFRTKETLMRISKMAEIEFENFLKTHPEIVKSRIKSADDKELFRLSVGSENAFQNLNIKNNKLT